MNARQLADICYEICPGFQGVYAKNTLPRRKERLIFNTADIDHRGEHWQAVFDGYFFCSLGLSNPFPRLKRVVNNPVQSYFSSTCGEHCIYFIHQYLHGLALGYTDDVEFNDDLVKDWMTCNFRGMIRTYDYDYTMCQRCVSYSNFNEM